MAYENDRYEKEEGGGSFLMGLLAGTVLGAGLGMLFAPKAGADLRNQIGEQAGRLRSTANETYSQASGKVNQMVDRGREAYDRARATVRHGDRGGDGQTGTSLVDAAGAGTASLTGVGATGSHTSNRG